MVISFVTCPNPYQSVSLLDTKRVGKMRVELKELIDAIEKRTAWSNHPASQMWIGYLTPLKIYYNITVREWIQRGCNNNMELYNIPDESEYDVIPLYFDGFKTYYAGSVRNPQKTFPMWFGWAPFYMSHRAA